jgi:nucleoside-diphosphate-sugar epimerase
MKILVTGAGGFIASHNPLSLRMTATHVEEICTVIRDNAAKFASHPNPLKAQSPGADLLCNR